MRTLSIHLNEEDIRGIDTPEVQQRIITAIAKYLKETASATEMPLNLTISAELKGTSGNALLRFAGKVDKDDLIEMHEAIGKYCEQVDSSEW